MLPLNQKPLHLVDAVHGEFYVHEALLIELLRSPEVERLKGLNQFGVPDKYYFRHGFSRYDHSVGVMLLLRKHGASLTEQAAGLLHDISHRAFSHVYDLLIDGAASPLPPQNRQDRDHLAFLQRSTIPGILATYGLSVEQIADLAHFPLLDQEAPNLCADRIDYALREFPQPLARDLAPHLVIEHGVFAFDTHASALQFGLAYLQLQRHNWGGSQGAVRYFYFAAALRRALDIGLITMDDFWLEDAAVLGKLESSLDPIIQQTLLLLSQRQLQAHGSFHKIYTKFRFVDPVVCNSRDTYHLSEREPNFQLLIQKAQRENLRGVMVGSIG